MANVRDGRLFIIANPASRRGRGKRIADEVARLLRKAKREVTLVFTSARGDAARLASEACGKNESPAVVVACGGDGTIQEVAGALAGHRATFGDSPALGLAPAGRCNDFAGAMGVSADPRRIVESLLRGQSSPVDLGRLADRYFCTVATVGIDADISRFVNDMRMPLQGTPAYVYGAFRVLLRYRARRLRLEGDFGVIEQPVFVASTANTSTYGGAVRIAPAACPDDGLLDLCLIDGLSFFEALRLVPRVLSCRHEGHPRVRFLRTRTLEIQCDERVEIWADGEPVGFTPARLEVVPGALRVVV
ncbi:MAG: diacylglycerol kinase family lipid kinase [Phycisphaerae bacterium]|nr:diacylglycerol kinase family lipid kinase [Phycisphaerae bacterium]